VASVAEMVRSAATVLEADGWPTDESRRDAEILARAALGWDAADWLTRAREPATPEFQAAFHAAMARRRLREPVAYIAGSREFYGRAFRVTPAVLIPRPETELVVDEALKVLADDRGSGDRTLEVADVGTGSGCLAVTIALETSGTRITATDVSTEALAVAADNARRLSADTRIEFVRTSLLGHAAGRFDLVVSNPPYVSERERFTLMPDVRDYEPALALFGGPDGLGVIRELLTAAGQGLRPGGWLIMEIGAGQADVVSAIAAASSPMAVVRVVPDLAGIPRVMVLTRPLPSAAGRSL
jgi:release factor glutamine methyltransferase